MDVIEKYLYAVGKRLPIKQREDIVNELRSVIMDNLDDRMQGNEATEEDINQVLIEMGSPYEVAKRYRTHGDYLIGPKLIDAFYMMLKIALIAVAGAHLIAVIVSLFATAGNISGIGDITDIIVQFFVKIWNIIPSLLSVAGAIVLVFIVIERKGGKNVMGLDEFKSEKWDPTKLEDVPKKDDIVKPVDSVFSIIFILIAIIVFNYFNSKIGIYYKDDVLSQWIFIGLNKEALELYIPIWTIVWTFSLALHGWLLGTGRYTIGSRILDIFISALNVGVLFYIANGPSFFDINNTISELEGIVDFLVSNHYIIFMILGIITLIEFIVKVIKFAIKRAKVIIN